MTKTDHTAATITAEQLAELKAAFEKATKDRLVVDGISYIDKSVSPPNPAPAYADVWTADPINGRRLFTLPYADACFFALAHNLMPSLIAAAEEAERLRNTLQLHAGDVMSLSNEIDRMQAYARDEFVAGRKEGLEKAAEVAESYADDQDKTVKARCIARAIRALVEEEPANV